MSNNTGIKQVAVRLNKEQWRAVSHYITDNDTSFQALVIKLLTQENIIKDGA